LRAQVAGLGKPAVVHLVGGEGPTATLEDCARAAVALARGEAAAGGAGVAAAPGEAVAVERLAASAAAELAPGQRRVRGVYCGGTLAWEALTLLRAALDDVAPGVTGGDAGHRVMDLGEDVFTVGRPHPMIDGTVRREWIRREAADPATAVLLLDVVLGYGAHPDPAGEVLPALDAARRDARAAGRGLALVASVVGTDADPQNRATQVARLEAGGVTVMPSNARAARLAALIARRAGGTA
jgi:hypothetical protein